MGKGQDGKDVEGGYVKYDPEKYQLPTEGPPDYKATVQPWSRVFNFSRPHMRGFHYSWFSFFLAFLGWFAFAPLMKVVGPEIGLTGTQGWNANIASVGSTVFMRFLVGPMLDAYGPRNIQSFLLMFGGIMIMISGAVVTDVTSLTICRFLIGIVGATFVPCQFWNAMLFTKEVAGTAQAMAGGWGNLGGGATQIIMPAIYKGILAVNGGDESMAWRTSFLVPGVALCLCAVCMYFFSDDCPRGNYTTLIKSGAMQKKKASASFRQGFGDPCTWMLAFQYGACFGVELTINNMMSSYFQNKFGLDIVSAGAGAASFGLMNIFARALGGIFSDYLNTKMGFKGRLWAQFLCLLLEGFMLIIFSRMNEFASALPMLLLFSLGVQMSEGTSFGIVPYIKPSATGAVSGVVGAGGNIGAVCWGMIFKFGGLGASNTLLVIGFIVVASALFTPLLFVSDQEGMFCNPRFKGGAPAETIHDANGVVIEQAQA